MKTTPHPPTLSLTPQAIYIDRKNLISSPSCVLKDKRRPCTMNSPTRNLPKVHPLRIPRSSSSLSFSPLSLSQNSNDSSFGGSISSWDRKIAVSFDGFFRIARGREEEGVEFAPFQSGDDDGGGGGNVDSGSWKRCSWITKSSEDHFVSFHDECWGVPSFRDNELFELLSMSGMLIDQNWAEIVRRREQYRTAFAEFDPAIVSKMEEDDVADISSKKELMLAEPRARCIVENAKCILKVAAEFGSFSEYVWGQVNHTPVVNRYRSHRSVPLRTPKSESVSRDLRRRGFRLVGPVIVYSFMQASGLVVDHLVGCFRFRELALRSTDQQRRQKRGLELFPEPHLSRALPGRNPCF